MLNLKHAKKACDEAFKALTANDEDSIEMSTNSLEGVAKGRYVLSLVADHLYKWFIKGDSKDKDNKDFDVQREIKLLLGSTIRLCMEGSSSTPQLYLLKQLVRRYGFDCVRILRGYKELERIIPPKARLQVRKC